MLVYIVTRGEIGRGKDIVTVFDNEETAARCALGQKRYYPGEWKPTEEKNTWFNGLDVVSVETHTVFAH